MITVLPAIDLKGGKCVRLRQGRMDDSTVYSEDPVEMAKRWVSQGAHYLHVVDLDGAIQGHPVHTEIITRIACSIPAKLEVGGGLRTDDDIKNILDCGASRAIVGTRAFAEPTALKQMVRKFGARLAVGIDARDGMVQIKGWVETTTMRAIEFAALVDKMRVKTMIYTDTATDGMMRGTNADAVAEICKKVRCDVIASGGISSVDDIKALCGLEQPNLIGAIVGKALYEGKAKLRELIAATE
jgi:phosphoribosylformimino-5-aminoimidazole carboxamide ribotide isomerase